MLLMASSVCSASINQKIPGTAGKLLPMKRGQESPPRQRTGRPSKLARAIVQAAKDPLQRTLSFGKTIVAHGGNLVVRQQLLAVAPRNAGNALPVAADGPFSATNVVAPANGATGGGSGMAQVQDVTAGRVAAGASASQLEGPAPADSNSGRARSCDGVAGSSGSESIIEGVAMAAASKTGSRRQKLPVPDLKFETLFEMAAYCHLDPLLPQLGPSSEAIDVTAVNTAVKRLSSRERAAILEFKFDPNKLALARALSSSNYRSAARAVVASRSSSLPLAPQ